MKVQVQKWGNSLALRIPKAFANESKLREGSVVDLSPRDGNLVITPIKAEEFALERLLKGVSRRNIHGETATGSPKGKEVW